MTKDHQGLAQNVCFREVFIFKREFSYSKRTEEWQAPSTQSVHFKEVFVLREFNNNYYYYSKMTEDCQGSTQVSVLERCLS